MKQLIITTIAAVVLVGCGESQQSAPAPETKPEPPTGKAPDISIHDAAKGGNIEVVIQHVAAGVDVNAKSEDKDGNGGTPLCYAAWHGRKEIAELLIAEGADVNAAAIFDRYTPLHYAVSSGHTEIAELLIAAGADVNAKDSHLGRTPLDEAKLPTNLFPGGHPETADLIRKHGGKTGEELKAEGKTK